MKQDMIHFITGEDYSYSGRCKFRIGAATGLLLLGIWAIWSSRTLAAGGQGDNFAGSYYLGTGLGLAAASVVTIIKNMRYIYNKELSGKREIYEKDERNRLLGLRCWSYAGFGTFAGLYIGTLVFAGKNETVLATLLAVMGGFAVLLLLVRMLLSKVM